MAAEGYDLLVKRDIDDAGISMVEKYGSGVVSYERPSVSAKDPTKAEWQELDGEDVYIPEDGLKIQGADLSVKLCYVGDYQTWPSVSALLTKYLLGGMLSLTDCYTGEKWPSCYFKSMEDVDVYSTEDCGDVVQYTLKFRLTNFSGE